MRTSKLNLKPQFNSLFGTVRTRLGRPQSRWLVLVTSGFALLVLAKIVLAAGQILDILNATYAAILT